MKKAYKIGLIVAVTVGVLGYVTKDTPKEKEAKYLLRGNDYFEKGEFLKARIEYKNAVKIIPTDPEIAYRWGLVDEAEGNIRNAFTNFMAAEQQSPHYDLALKRLAHYLLAGNQNEEAKKRIDILLADTPDDAEARALNAALYLRKDDKVNAEKEAKFALSKDPANITATSVLTGLYLSQKDLAKSTAVLEEGIKKNPKDISLLMLKASIYENPFNADKIKETYDAVFVIRPTEPQFRFLLAQTYLTTKMIDKAEEALRKGVEAIPESWDMKHALINFLDQNRKMEVAEKELQSMIQKYPDNADLVLWLSNLYVTHDETDKAITVLQKVASQSEGDKQSLNAKTSIARISFIKGDKELAENIVNAVLKKSPANRDALFIRANLSVDRGLYENAVIDLRSIIRDDPKSKDSLKLLGEVLLIQGYTDLSIETFNQLVDLDPSNAANRTRLAQLYGLSKDTKRALDQLKIVTESDPKYPVGWESIARIAISNKDNDMAKSAIEKLKALDGQQATATYLEAQLADSNNKREEAIALYKKVIEADPATPLAERSLFSLAVGTHDKDEMEKTATYLAALAKQTPYTNTLLGESYIQLGKRDLAYAALDKAIASHPVSQDSYIDRSKLLMEDKKPDEAIETLKQASLEAPDDVRASLMQASILSGAQKYKEAVDIYETILIKKPQIALAANNMAAIIADQFYTDAAMLEKARLAVERFADSKNMLMLDTIGWLNYRLGKTEQSVSFLAKAVTADDKVSPEVHYHYGAALLKSGNKPLAKTELTKAVAPEANYPSLPEAKKLLSGI